MKRIKEFVQKHKGKIIIGTVIVGGAILTYINAKGGGSVVDDTEACSEFSFKFDNLEEALAKWQELGAKRESGNVAMWNGNANGEGITVQNLH